MRYLKKQSSTPLRRVASAAIDLVAEERVVRDRILERGAHFLPHRGGAPGPTCRSTTRSITRSSAALASIRPGRQLGRDVRGEAPPAAAAAASDVLLRRVRRPQLVRELFSELGPTGAGRAFALLLVDRSTDRRTATGTADLPCHAVSTLTCQARMFETAALAVSCLARMTFDTVVNR